MNELHTEKRLRTAPPFAAMVLRIAHSKPWARTDEERNMKNLIYSLTQICRHNRDGSYKTQADRQRILLLIGKQLLEMGYRLNHAGGLGTRHIEALVKRWTAIPQEMLEHFRRLGTQRHREILRIMKLRPVALVHEAAQLIAQGLQRIHRRHNNSRKTMC